MAGLLFLGDEASAAGWRLGGARACVCAEGEEAAALDAALATAQDLADDDDGLPLVLVSAAVAERVDAQRLRQAASALAPLVLVVPDPQGRAPRPDLAARLRLQLGLEGREPATSWGNES